MVDILVFGTGEIAELAHFYFTHDTEHRVVAFTVDSAYLKESHFCGLPVVPFEEVGARFSPAKHDGFVALSYTKVNQVRADKCAAMQRAGYRLQSYVSSKATTFTDLRIGRNCFILEDNTVQPNARIGDNVTLWSGNHVGHHSNIGNNVFVSSHVVISGGVTIGDSCFLGVNSTIRDHVRLGRSCVIGAGALILEDTDDESVYIAAAAEKSRVPSSRLRRI